MRLYSFVVPPPRTLCENILDDVHSSGYRSVLFCMTTTMLFVYPGLGPYLRKFRQLLCKITRGGVESNPDRGEVGWGVSAEPPAASKPHFAQSRVLSYIYYHSQESASVDPALTP